MGDLNFKEKVYLVTGSASGIGKSCAEKLLESGAVVIGIDKQEAVIEAPLYEHFQAEITDENEIERIINESAEKYGKIDGLVNAAGRWGNVKPFYEVDTSDWESVLSVNLTGIYIVSKYAARVMIPRKQGRIVNISCIRASIFRNNMVDYAASKGAVVSMTSAMALDLAPYNIQVNSVAPGFTPRTL